MSSQEMEQIIQEYGDDIYRFCFHLTGSREEADDLYQDTFVKAIQIGHRLDRGGNIKSFLMGISVNLWKNRTKKDKRRRELIPEVSYESGINSLRRLSFFVRFFHWAIFWSRKWGVM